MKNVTKRTIAAMSAALMLMTGGIVASYAQEDTMPIAELTEAEGGLKLDHNYLIGNMTIGKSDEENAIASQDGQLYLYVSDETIVVGEDGSHKTLEDIKEGTNIEFYIDANAPTTLQMPVHYTPQVIVVKDSETDSLIFREIGVFDEDLVNEENTLKLNLSKETAYYSKTRDIFHGGKALVFYDVTTRSIPAQTTPKAIVKLNDDLQAETDTGSNIDHNYLVGSMTVGKSDEDNAIASEDGELYLYKNDNTYVLSAKGEKLSFEDLKEGTSITYYADCNAPTTLQLPVHYNPQVIVVEDEASAVIRTIGVFDEDLVNEDNTLRLNMGKETAYYSETRDIFHGGKALVFYDVATMSIPAQTTPLAIVKLNDDSQEPEVDLSQVKKVVIGEKTIDHVPVVVDGVQMLPVREFAEAMGYKVDWDNNNQTVTVGQAFFAIDTDSYVIGRRAPMTLGQAPVLIDIEDSGFASTYVPVTFFTQVLGETITVDGDTATVQVPETTEE